MTNSFLSTKTLKNLQFLIVAIFLLFMFAFAFEWLSLGFQIFPNEKDFLSALELQVLDHPLQTSQIALGLASTLLPLLALSIIFTTLYLLLESLKNRCYFDATHIRKVRIIALGSFCWSIFEPIYQSLKIFIITMNNPVGHRIFSFSLDISNLLAVVLGIILLIGTFFIKETNRLHEESELTI